MNVLHSGYWSLHQIVVVFVDDNIVSRVTASFVIDIKRNKNKIYTQLLHWRSHSAAIGHRHRRRRKEMPNNKMKQPICVCIYRNGFIFVGFLFFGLFVVQLFLNKLISNNNNK